MSNPVAAFWVSLGRGARIALLGGVTLGIALLVWALLFAFREDYRVLFAELSESDAAADSVEAEAGEGAVSAERLAGRQSWCLRSRCTTCD